MSAGEVNLTWEPPGPGRWSRDRVHFPHAATAHVTEMFPAIEEGFAYSAERFGWLMERLELRCVNSALYGMVIPVPPERMASRCETAAQVFETRLWRRDVDRWDDEVKPAAMRAHRDLIEVDPSCLPDDELAAYLRRCRDHHYDMWLQHHRFNGAYWVPVGDFLAAAGTWTGLPQNELVLLLTGWSPVSRGHCPEVEQLAKAIASDAGAQAALRDGGDPAAVLGALAACGGEVAAALSDWLVVTGYRLIEGFDICFPYALERPSLLVAALSRLSDAGSKPVLLENGGERLAAVRERVPAEHRQDFDERFEEARRSFHVRDERGIYSDATAAGIVRRAWLAAGARLVARGVLDRAELAIDATCDELCELLGTNDSTRSAAAALAAALEQRAAFRATGVPGAPEILGDEGEPDGPPPTDSLPPMMARMMAAVMGAPDTPVEQDPSDESALAGLAASPGVYRGTARIVRTADDLDRLDVGDVMVTTTTGEAFNVAIAIVGALVTDVGGLMSHAGITSREYGIPAVVRTGRATEVIPEGALVEVDGNAGVVRWS